MPQVNGGKDSAIGYRPYLSPLLKRNSWIGTESGGSKGSLGMYDGVVNGILAKTADISLNGQYDNTSENDILQRKMS